MKAEPVVLLWAVGRDVELPPGGVVEQRLIEMLIRHRLVGRFLARFRAEFASEV